MGAVYPYGSEVNPGQQVELKLILWNHSPSKQNSQITLHLPAGWKTPKNPLVLPLGDHQEGSVSFPVLPPGNERGLAVITADIRCGLWDLRHWIEAMVNVK